MLMSLEYFAPREFPGGQAVRTPHFHWQGPWFDPWLGKQDTSQVVGPKKKKKPHTHPIKQFAPFDNDKNKKW